MSCGRTRLREKRRGQRGRDGERRREERRGWGVFVEAARGNLCFFYLRTGSGDVLIRDGEREAVSGCDWGGKTAGLL